MLSEDSGKFLLKFVREVIEGFVLGKEMKMPAKYPSELDSRRGVFVSLYKSQKLRGCIGITDPQKPLIFEAARAARSACRDPRFPPLTPEELEEIRIEISILTKPEQITFKKSEELLDKLTTQDGLILELGHHTGLFLPQVWSQIPKKEDFLAALCFKAGIPDPLAWLNPAAKLYKFRVQVFKEAKT
jgi:hypothetical protein